MLTMMLRRRRQRRRNLPDELWLARVLLCEAGISMLLLLLVVVQMVR